MLCTSLNRHRGEMSFSYLFRFVQNDKKKPCHSIADTLIFVTMQKLRSYTQAINAQWHAEVGLAFLIHPVY